MATGGKAGGTQLGAAFGRIRIDTSDLNKVRTVVSTVAQEAERGFRRIDQSARSAQARMASFAEGIGKIREELQAVNAKTSALVGVGLRTASSLEEARIQLTGMLRDTQKAVNLMDDMRKKSIATGVPFSDMLQVANQLLPTLQGNTEELEKWSDLARRVATRNRSEGVAGAAFAINEAIASGGTDLVSLAERFNISRVKLREAVDAHGGDFAAALDDVLNQMGVTIEVADEMGRTFNASLRSASDAAGQLLGEGFEPMLSAMTPLLQGTANFLSQLRDTSPVAATAASGLITLTAAASGALLVFGQLAQAAQNLKKTGALGALGKGGFYATAAVVGGEVGFQVGNLINKARGDDESVDADRAGTFRAMRQTLFLAYYGISEAIGEIKDIFDGGGVLLRGAMAGMIQGIADIISWLADIIPGWAGGNALRDAAGSVQESADNWRQARSDKLSTLADRVEEREQRRIDSYEKWLDILDARGRAELQAQQEVENRASGAFGAAGYDKDQAAVIHEWAQSVQEVERQANEQRLVETQQYEQQRTETIANYERSIAREAEDIARQRARREAQLAQQIADIRQSTTERERVWTESYVETVAEIRADSNERIAELEEDYARNRVRRERQHRDNLLNAAARLDAHAVASEQRRYERETKDAEDAHKDRISDEHERLRERFESEREAHQERLQQARKADEQRIQDMVRAQAEQQRLEDEDRAIRLTRQAEDHAANLDHLAQNHADAMTKIEEDVARERTELNNSLVQELADQGLYRQAWFDAQENKQKDSLEQFKKFWDDFGAMFPDNYRNQGGVVGEYQTGGYVPRTGLAKVHAGEYVLNPRTTTALRDMLGGMSQRDLVAMAGSRSVNLALHQGAIQVNAAPGQDAGEIAFLVRQELAGFLQEVI